jgi:DNA-directed RNA polymerase specialized sigma24 family protein
MSDRGLVQPITGERGYLTAVRWRDQFREALAQPGALAPGLGEAARQGILRGYERYVAELDARIAEYEGLVAEQSAEPVGGQAAGPEAPLADRIAAGWVHGSRVAARLVELRQDSRAALESAALTNLEVAVLALLFGEDMSVAECARTLEMSPAAVSEARANALRKLSRTGALDAWAEALTGEPPPSALRQATG